MNAEAMDRTEWSPFRIGDLFSIRIGKSIDANKISLGSEGHPYITRKAEDNGFVGILDYNASYLNTETPVITIGNETCEPFIQTYPFFTGTKVNILSPIERMSAECLQFIATSIRMCKPRYSYSYTINSTRLRNQRILLPSKNGKPDYAFMERYMSAKRGGGLDAYLAYISDIIDEGMLMTLVHNQEWADVRLLDYFYPIKGNQNNMDALKPGIVPLVSARKVENGYKDFVSIDRTYSGHCLTINNDGDGGAGVSFYQPFDMALDSHVTALIPTLELSKQTLLFIATSITKQREKFGHGYALNSNRLSSLRIMLPIANGEPDWSSMESYMRFKEQTLLDRYRAYLSELELGGGGRTLTRDMMCEFRIGDLFDLCRGNYSGTHSSDIMNGISYVGATNRNNGVLGFSLERDRAVRKPCIAFINNGDGSIGLSVYKGEPFVASQDVTLGFNPNIDRYTGTFVTTIADGVRGKYSFGYKRNTERLAAERLLLPADGNGNPDWAFMRHYMMLREARLIGRYLEHLAGTMPEMTDSPTPA